MRDIINISTRRNPGIELILYPARVQGEGAAQSVADGLAKLDALGLDVIIVGRGGGSIEDLWAFNEELVARAIFACHTPVISAVGHETDTTIADYVADLRAPTPSAAAELAVMDVRGVQERLQDERRRMERLLWYRIESSRMRLDEKRMRLEHLSPVQRVRELRMRAADLEEQLETQMKMSLQERRHQMAVYIERMKGLSPLEKLAQGYAAVTDGAGKRVFSVEQVHKDEELELLVSDGKIVAQVMRTEKIR